MQEHADGEPVTEAIAEVPEVPGVDLFDREEQRLPRYPAVCGSTPRHFVVCAATGGPAR